MKSPYLAALLAFAMVMTGMLVLTAVCYLLRRLGHRREGPPEEDALEPELIAVLTAAAREALQAPVSLHHVHVHREPTVERWSSAGRMDVMISHRVERKR